jgi:hypothetical protein
VSNSFNASFPHNGKVLLFLGERLLMRNHRFRNGRDQVSIDSVAVLNGRAALIAALQQLSGNVRARGQSRTGWPPSSQAAAVLAVRVASSRQLPRSLLRCSWRNWIATFRAFYAHRAAFLRGVSFSRRQRSTGSAMSHLKTAALPLIQLIDSENGTQSTSRSGLWKTLGIRRPYGERLPAASRFE